MESSKEKARESFKKELDKGYGIINYALDQEIEKYSKSDQKNLDLVRRLPPERAFRLEKKLEKSKKEMEDFIEKTKKDLYEKTVTDSMKAWDEYFDDTYEKIYKEDGSIDVDFLISLLASIKVNVMLNSNSLIDKNMNVLINDTVKI